MQQIVLDTETTGRSAESGHRIIEIGAIIIRDRVITDEIFHTYINPERDSEEGALAVHGLSQSFLEDKPLFSQIIDDFLTFLNPGNKKQEVVIHNAKFDVGFFDAEIKRHNSQSFKQSSSKQLTYQPLTHYCHVIDSLKLAREMHPTQRNSLDALCKRYNIDNSKRNLHGALLDAELLAQVYLAMTAGQSSFFDMAAINANTASSKTKVNTSMFLDLPIHFASKAENTAHSEKLSSLQQSSNTCLWEDHKTKNST